MPEDRRGYEVGYGKPPQHTRFQKGQSGNPKGRRRGSKNHATLLLNELNERLVVKENGHRKTITKGEAMIKQLVNKAVSGDSRSIKLLLSEIREIQGGAGATDVPQISLDVVRELTARAMAERC